MESFHRANITDCRLTGRVLTQAAILGNLTGRSKQPSSRVYFTVLYRLLTAGSTIFLTAVCYCRRRSGTKRMESLHSLSPVNGTQPKSRLGLHRAIPLLLRFCITEIFTSTRHYVASAPEPVSAPWFDGPVPAPSGVLDSGKAMPFDIRSIRPILRLHISLRSCSTSRNDFEQDALYVQYRGAATAPMSIRTHEVYHRTWKILHGELLEDDDTGTPFRDR